MARLLPLALAVGLTAFGGCADHAPDATTTATSGSAETTVQSNESDQEVLLPEAGGEVEVDTSRAAEVTLEGETVPTRAVVTEIESEDRSCYVTLRTDDGDSETVYADYSLCDTDGLIGRRVQIEYAPGTVMAASCEADPDCLETESVALAVAAEVID